MVENLSLFFDTTTVHLGFNRDALPATLNPAGPKNIALLNCRQGLCNPSKEESSLLSLGPLPVAGLNHP